MSRYQDVDKEVMSFIEGYYDSTRENEYDDIYNSYNTIEIIKLNK